LMSHLVDILQGYWKRKNIIMIQKCVRIYCCAIIFDYRHLSIILTPYLVDQGFPRIR
jgi:hypothetical protein